MHRSPQQTTVQQPARRPPIQRSTETIPPPSSLDPKVLPRGLGQILASPGLAVLIGVMIVSFGSIVGATFGPVAGIVTVALCVGGTLFYLGYMAR